MVRSQVSGVSRGAIRPRIPPRLAWLFPRLRRVLGVCSGGKWGGVGSWRGVRKAAVGVVLAARPVVGSVEVRRVARVVAQLLEVVQRLGGY